MLAPSAILRAGHGLRSMHANLRLLNATLDEANHRVLNLKLSVDETQLKLRFPLSMLRDNCSSNFHPSTLQRLTPMCKEVLSSAAEKVEASTDGSSLRIHWAGEPIRTAAFADKALSQVSEFGVGWLYQHAIERRMQRALDVCWWSDVRPLSRADFMQQREATVNASSAVGVDGRSLGDSSLRFDYEQLMTDDGALLHFLRRLWSHGLVFVANVDPVDRAICQAAEEAPAPWDPRVSQELPEREVARQQVERSLRRLQERISFARQTHYGVCFHVKSKENANNQAYTTQELQLHTDLPFYSHAPDVQILHCVQNDMADEGAILRGGESTFSDGMAAALNLWQKHPNAYRLLKEKKVMYSDWHREGLFQFNSEKSIITEAISADAGSAPIISRIHFNEGVRSHFLNSCGSPEEVDDLYAALLRLQEELDDPELRISLLMRPGDMVAWNNNRVLHGRKAFSGGAYRHLVGGYLDWDDVWSCRRRLEQSVA